MTIWSHAIALARSKSPMESFTNHNVLLIFLYVIGATGSNGIYRKVGSRFNISSGAVRLYVDRVTHAILDTIECNTVY
jgi:hypothetical protein